MSSKSNRTPKWIVYVGGFASIATIIGVLIAYTAFVHPSPGGSDPGITINNTNDNKMLVPTPIVPTPNPTPTPSPIWKIIIDQTDTALTYNNYTVNDTQGHHFLLVVASFENISSASQPLTGGLFDLQDENGQYYTEDKASNPGQSFVVNPGQSIETTTSFVVPNSSCRFQLSFSAGNSAISQWNINSSSMCL